MSLEQATKAVQDAIDAGDLGSLARALAARENVLKASLIPSREAFDAGEKALQSLQALKHRWAEEDAKLRLRHSFADSSIPSESFDLKG